MVSRRVAARITAAATVMAAIRARSRVPGAEGDVAVVLRREHPRCAGQEAGGDDRRVGGAACACPARGETGWIDGGKDSSGRQD